MGLLELEVSHATMTENLDRLAAEEYVGRLIISGAVVTDQGEHQIQHVYVLGGRSSPSRNREGVEEYDGIRVVAPGKTQEEMQEVENASLIYYKPMKAVGGVHVVSNGAQTEPIAFGLLQGQDLMNAALDAPFLDGVDLSNYEPDAPNNTPRIVAVADLRPAAMTPFGIGVIRKSGPESTMSNLKISTFKEARLENLPDGVGYCVHTYEGADDSNPIPSFNGDPYPVPLESSIEATAELYLDRLNPKNLATLVVKGIDRATGRVSYSIHNNLQDRN